MMSWGGQISIQYCNFCELFESMGEHIQGEVVEANVTKFNPSLVVPQIRCLSVEGKWT